MSKVPWPSCSWETIDKQSCKKYLMLEFGLNKTNCRTSALKTVMFLDFFSVFFCCWSIMIWLDLPPCNCARFDILFCGLIEHAGLFFFFPFWLSHQNAGKQKLFSWLITHYNALCLLWFFWLSRSYIDNIQMLQSSI